MLFFLPLKVVECSSASEELSSERFATLHVSLVLLSLLCSNLGCGGTSSSLLHKQRTHPLQCVGHSRPGEVWGAQRRLLHSGTVCNYHVRRDGPGHLQECSQLASRLGTGLWKHSYCVVWEQGGYQGSKGEGKVHRLPQEKEPAGNESGANPVIRWEITGDLIIQFYGIQNTKNLR